MQTLAQQLDEIRLRLDRLEARPLTPIEAPAGEMILDEGHRQVLFGSVRVYLQPRRFALMKRLLAARGNVVPNEALIDAIWGNARTREPADMANCLRVMVCNIGDNFRSKGLSTPIRSFRGVGYAIIQPKELT